MTGRELLEGMGHIDDRFVDEAEFQMLPRRNALPWMRWGAMAACLCLILFGLRHVKPIFEQEASQGGAGGSAPDLTLPAGIESAVLPPEQAAAGEVPSVILRVGEWNRDGFTATVAETVATDIFEVGTELNVVLADSLRYQMAEDAPIVQQEGTNGSPEASPQYVIVQFISFDIETNTIVINMIEPWNGG